MFAAPIAGLGTGAGQMATTLVRFIIAIIVQVTQKLPGYATAVGASELSVWIAGFRSFGAQGHVILVRAVLAVIMAVADLPAQDAPTVVALETIPAAAFVSTFFWFLVRVVTTVIDAVTSVFHVDTDVVVTFEPLRRAKFATYRNE